MLQSPVFILCILCILLWIIFRILRLIILWGIRRLSKNTVKSADVGFLSLSNLTIQLLSGVSLEIGSVWICSSYISSAFRKPLTFCCSNVRLEIDLEKVSNRRNEEFEVQGGVRCKKESTTKGNKKIEKLFQLLSKFQFCGVQVSELDVLVVKGPIADSLFHAYIASLSGDASFVRQSLRVTFDVRGMKYSWIKGQGEKASCVSAGSMDSQIGIRIGSEAYHSLGVEARIEKLSSTLSRGQPHRPLNVKVAEISFGAECGEGVQDLQSLIASTQFCIKGLAVTSQTANIMNVIRLSTKMEVSQDDISVTLLSTGLFIGYQHGEVWPCVHVIMNTIKSEPAKQKSVSVKSVKKGKQPLEELLRHRSVTWCVEMDHTSVAMATDKCAGLKGGFVNFTFAGKYSPQFQDGDIDLRLEVSSIYLKLAKGGVTFTNLNPAVHHWNTALYIITFLIKGKKVGNTLELDQVVNASQLEISPSFVSVISNLLSAISLSVLSSRAQKQRDMHVKSRNDTQLNPEESEPNEAKSDISDTNNGQSKSTSSVLFGGTGDHTSHDSYKGASSLHLGAVAETHDLSCTKQGLNITWNIQLTGINVYFCTELRVFTLFRLDSITICKETDFASIKLTQARCVYSKRDDNSCVIKSCDEISNYSVLIRSAFVEINSNKNEIVSIQVCMNDDVYLEWSMHLHLSIYTVLQDVISLKTALHTQVGEPEDSTLGAECQSAEKKKRKNNTPCVVLNLDMRRPIVALQLAQSHTVVFTVSDVRLRSLHGVVTCTCAHVVVTFDRHDVIFVEHLGIERQLSCEKISLERANMPDLHLTSNKVVSVEMSELKIVFPYKYNFGSCLQQLIGLNKWRKIIHKKVKKAFTVDSPLPHDMLIQVKKASIQLSDDPFEVKLGDNYQLIKDENVEHGRRIVALENKLPELSNKHGFLSASKIEALYTSLNKKSADVYVHRSKHLYVTSPIRSKLATWSMENVEIIALADPSLHGQDNVIKHMRDIDAASPYPGVMVDYSTLFCRMVTTSVDTLKIQLRDFPLPMLEVSQLSVWGRLVGAEETGRATARRKAVIEMEEPWGNCDVTKNMPTIKFYHDFSSDVGVFNIAYGPCWEPVMSYVNLAMNLLTKSSVDPSPPLPFWDKIRLWIHGRLTMCVERMSWLYHASLNPYNTTELMDWTWTNLVLDWTNAKWLLKGDLDIYARTASKYDDCCLLHLPNLRFCVRLEWLCDGDANGHHLVQPTDPVQIPANQKQGWDSYKDFRSRNLNMEISFECKGVPKETKQGDEGDSQANDRDSPTCVFFASTMRWLDRIQQCITHVSRPIRRGKLHGPVRPKKQGFSRHFKNVRLSVNVDKFSINYWVSHAKHSGVEVHGKSLALLCGLELNLITASDNLKRRARSEWSIKQLGVEQNDVTIWLCSTSKNQSTAEEGDGTEEAIETPESLLKRNYFVSVGNVVYQRAEEPDQSMDISGYDLYERPQHRLQVHHLKGCWTPSNRNVVFDLYDNYDRAQTLRKNLSTEALKRFKVDTQAMTPPRMSKPVSTDALSPSPGARLQSGPAYDLLERLVNETDSKFIVSHEVAGGNVQVEQLQGITACQQDDVIRRNWHVELYNSQVMLKGCEEKGYVIVGAAKASILTSDHRPVWKEQTLRSKSTVVGSLDCMQYYATIYPSCNDESSSASVSVVPQESRDEIQPMAWLSADHIEEEEVDSLMGIEGMVSGAQAVGGVVDEPSEKGLKKGTRIQLQRIISRCKCQFFYAGYGDVIDDAMVEVPPLPVETDDMMKSRDEHVDTFTLLHHDLNICTNSSQYLLMQDLVNNLLLHVDSKKKERVERHQRMKFKLHLNSIDDQKTPILQSQNELRELVQKLRRLERQLYILRKELQDEPDDEVLLEEKRDAEKQLDDCKHLVGKASEELAILIRAFKEMQLEEQAQLRATMGKDDAMVVKKYEVCFKHAEWRMTESDGQIGIADVKLTNFLYQKINKDDDSGSHQMELGYLKVTNLLPDTLYKELLGPQECNGAGLGMSDKHSLLRLLCKFKAPVGGIAIKEHFEVNVLPLSLQLTKRFYNTAMVYFFPDRRRQSDAARDEEKSKKKRHTHVGESTFFHDDDIDKMKQRAAKNQMFLYVKIPEVPLTVSYKGLKDKNVTDVQNFRFVVPTLEYHNQTWTYLDLLMAMKNDCKKVLISQAIKQKLHMRSPVAELVDLGKHSDSLQQEDEKAKMLLGEKHLSDKAQRKSFFGKSSKLN